MQCEESFRDAKNLRLGLGLSHMRSRHPRRIEVLCLLTALAGFVATVLGVIAYHHQIHSQLQANTVKHRLVFSLPRLGTMAFRMRLLSSITRSIWAHAILQFPILYSKGQCNASLKTSAGVLKPNVFRGRPLSSRAIFDRSVCV